MRHRKPSRSACAGVANEPAGAAKLSGQRNLRGSFKQGALDGGYEGEHKGGDDEMRRFGCEPDRLRRRHRCTHAASGAGRAFAAIVGGRGIGGLFARIIEHRRLMPGAMVLGSHHRGVIVVGHLHVRCRHGHRRAEKHCRGSKALKRDCQQQEPDDERFDQNFHQIILAQARHRQGQRTLTLPRPPVEADQDSALAGAVAPFASRIFSAAFLPAKKAWSEL